MNKYYTYLSYYLAYVVLPYLLVNEILLLNKNKKLDISFLKLTNRIKKVINIKDINYHKLKYITNNILMTKYNYMIISYYPIKLSYVIKK